MSDLPKVSVKVLFRFHYGWVWKNRVSYFILTKDRFDRGMIYYIPEQQRRKMLRRNDVEK